MRSKGWSLLEVLVVVTVAAVAGGLLVNIMVSSGKIFVDQNALITQGLSLNQTQLELTELIKSSAGISGQYPAQGSPQFTTDSNTLVIKLPAVDSAGNVINSVYDFAVIDSDSGNPKILRKQIFKDNQSYRKTENKVLTTNLKSISFSYLDVNNTQVSYDQAVRIGFIINLLTPSGFADKESSGSGTVNLKNI